MVFKKSFIISDAHLWHDKAFIYKDRGFESSAAHDEFVTSAMLKLPKGSTLLSLGNMFFNPKHEKVKELVLKLRNAGIHLMCIEGPHDREFLWSLKNDGLIVLLGDMAMLAQDKTNVVVSHYPLELWPQKKFGYMALHGHTRAQLPSSIGTRRMDCSVDSLLKASGHPLASLSSIATSMNKITV